MSQFYTIDSFLWCCGVNLPVFWRKTSSYPKFGRKIKLQEKFECENKFNEKFECEIMLAIIDGHTKYKDNVDMPLYSKQGDVAFDVLPICFFSFIFFLIQSNNCAVYIHE